MDWCNMDIICYLPSYPHRSQLLSLLAQVQPEAAIAVRPTLEALAESLPHRGGELTCLVVAPESALDLKELSELAPLWADAALVLIAPDAQPGTLALAHKLRPRFLGHASTRPQVVVAVVSKIADKLLRQAGLPSPQASPPPTGRWAAGR